MQFADIIGQEELKRHFQKAIGQKKLSHAYIISGEEHSGKRMLAEAFAQTLLCEERGLDACGHCKHCKQTQSKNQPDLIYLQHEKPNTISVEDIRTQIKGDIDIKPYQSPYKIYIIDEAEKMNEQAQNALLKTIEEPPEYAILLLLTTNHQRFLPTILSRCILLETKPISQERIRRVLEERYELPQEQMEMAISFAQGNLGQAITLVDSEDFIARRKRILSLLGQIADMNYVSRLTFFDEMEEDKDALGQYLDLLLVYYRDVLLYKVTKEASGIIFSDQIYPIRRMAEGLSYRHIEQIFETIADCRRKRDANVNTRLILQELLERMQRERR